MEKIPEEDLLAEIHRLADGNEPPTSIEMREEGRYSSVTYQNRFGWWTNALEVAGYSSSQRTYTNEELLATLREMADDLGWPPSSHEMRTEGPHAPSTYRDRFGTWAAALEAAGLDPARGRNRHPPSRE